MANYYGTNGNDTLNGTRNNDIFYFYDGNDICFSNNGDDVVYGGGGNDQVYGSGGNDWIDGGSGDDLLFGGIGNDTLYGGTGNDRIEGCGGSSNDFDSLYGGSGSDVFVLGSRDRIHYRGASYATIRDWNYAEDWIQVRGSASQYRLVTGNWTGSLSRDTAIVYDNDIIGLVQDSTNVSLSRDFKFV